ncbi:MAG TPA: tRNA (adenosine(37)-N6)-threonylcarbamoyltransferase complex dimerization subunit type 1 TsaB [Bacteroidales bacterium]|nr:tRNA (adenosine(37)-N6)-threonylcarbamoyltransferase complex dimerization subunit type 1 TsaB [Bacteroidales bacterium]
MNLPNILYIETATNVCAVAISHGNELIGLKKSHEDKSHGRLLTTFIEELLAEQKLSPSDIDAIAVSKGPGSYTGLRIGVSVCKGFAYGQDIPVIGINTMEALASGILKNQEVKTIIQNSPDTLLCPMIDARRMEVYYGLFSPSLERIESVGAKIIDKESFSGRLEKGKIIFFGNGSEKIQNTIYHNNARFINNFQASAEYMIPLAMKAWENKQFEDTAYFEPFYLKDFIATTPKKKVI